MLYPNFDDLVAFKSRRARLASHASRPIQSMAAGNDLSPFRGQGLEFDAVRQYVPGDDIRSIDWRVTARMGSPHVKLFREERERHTMLCVDMNTAMRFGTRKTFKSVQAAYAAAFLGWQAVARQDKVGGILFGDVPRGLQFFAPKRTSKSFCSLLKALAEPPKENHVSSWEANLERMNETIQTGSLVYLISDFMDSCFQNEAALDKLNKRCDLIFISINDPADKEILPIGSIMCSSSNGEKIYMNTESLQGRKTYAAQWEENRKKLREISIQLKIPVIELTTESDIHQDLTIEFKNLSKKR